MSWETKLNSMVGTTFLRNNEDFTIESYTRKGDTVKVKTSGGDFEKHVEQLPAFLATFKPMAGPAPEALSGVAILAAPSKLQIMQDALMTCLRKVQGGEGDLEEAKVVSKIVQTGINLARLELEAIKVARA